MTRDPGAELGAHAEPFLLIPSVSLLLGPTSALPVFCALRLIRVGRGFVLSGRGFVLSGSRRRPWGTQLLSGAQR